MESNSVLGKRAGPTLLSDPKRNKTAEQDEAPFLTPQHLAACTYRCKWRSLKAEDLDRTLFAQISWRGWATFPPGFKRVFERLVHHGVWCQIKDTDAIATFKVRLQLGWNKDDTTDVHLHQYRHLILVWGTLRRVSHPLRKLLGPNLYDLIIQYLFPDTALVFTAACTAWGRQLGL